MFSQVKSPRDPPPELSDIGCLDNVCPNCGKSLLKRPQRKAKCPHCGMPIFVRTRPLDRKPVLLTEEQTSQLENEWVALGHGDGSGGD
jgi:DNA-directed RNA polymerase subunit RPC12/RpoP